MPPLLPAGAPNFSGKLRGSDSLAAFEGLFAPRCCVRSALLFEFPLPVVATRLSLPSRHAAVLIASQSPCPSSAELYHSHERVDPLSHQPSLYGMRTMSHRLIGMTLWMVKESGGFAFFLLLMSPHFRAQSAAAGALSCQIHPIHISNS